MTVSSVSELERETIRRVYWRLIPILFAMMFFNYLDRINLGYAGLTMNKDLGLSSAIFGFAASVFFLGYMVLEVPSNLMLHLLGARIWLARILITWGLVATLTAFIWSPLSLYVMRFGLGVAEAGFMPGVVLYLTYWFPPRYRARAVAGYIIAGSFSAVAGGPISTSVMTWFDGAGGLHGWQWMFIVEGVPTILLGLFTLYYLTDRPAKATWLTPEQAAWLEGELATERASIEQQGQHRVIDCILDIRVWLLAALFGCALVGIYGLLLWLPQIIKGMGNLSNIEVGFLSAIPPLLGVVGTILISRSSDRTGDRKFHLAGVYLLAAIAMLASAYVQSPVLAFAFLCVAGFGINSGNPLFWSINASLMTGAAGAASIATVNTLAQFGGLIGPWCIGLIKDSTGSFSWALVGIAGFLLVASAIAATMRVKPRETELTGAIPSSFAH
ncbi:membrane protein [Bradyrhizobium sp. LTSP885]|uniref:MFS transporter n=1 Tax=Bradyrhizobium sp. LTSP885 TaxID=1619232 RepID=UPI0005CADD8E|nr:MFS transporter [Bradyrhizobium sp. LTSP885]KJC40412.1 membrane protein [Bradyrhizobium sp. LTSP885]